MESTNRLLSQAWRVAMTVRDGATVAHVRFARSPAEIDWGEVESAVFGAGAWAGALLCLPEEGVLHTLGLEREDDGFVLDQDPLQGEVE